MTKMHFEAIAALLAAFGAAEDMTPYQSQRMHELVCNMADYFASVNPRFNRAKFVEAAGF